MPKIKKSDCLNSLKEKTKEERIFIIQKIIFFLSDQEKCKKIKLSNEHCINIINHIKDKLEKFFSLPDGRDDSNMDVEIYNYIDSNLQSIGGIEKLLSNKIFINTEFSQKNIENVAIDLSRIMEKNSVILTAIRSGHLLISQENLAKLNLVINKHNKNISVDNTISTTVEIRMLLESIFGGINEYEETYNSVVFTTINKIVIERLSKDIKCNNPDCKCKEKQMTVFDYDLNNFKA